MIRVSILVLLLASVHASSSRAQGRLSCYRLTVGPWRPALRGDTVFHRLPSVIRLDTLAWDAKGRHLSPRITYPGISSSQGFPGTPRWEASGDTIRLIWSNGFAPTIVTLLRTSAALKGEAVAESDAHPIPEQPRPRATVIAEPLSCDSLHLRSGGVEV